MAEILLSKVKVIDSQSSLNGKTVDLLIAGEEILKVAGPGTLPPEKAWQHHEGGCVSPGWLDFRVHLTDPGFEWKESLESLSQAALAGGFTSLLCLPNTYPAIDHANMVKSLQHRVAGLPVNFLFAACVTKGGKGEEMAELYDMHRAGAVAFTEGKGSLHSAGILQRGLQYLSAFSGILMDLPLDESLVAGAEIGEGERSTLMGMKGIPSIAETIRVDRNLALLDYYGGRLHLGPISCGDSLASIEAAKASRTGLSVETSALYLLLDEEALENFGTEYKLMPPLRTRRDREMLCAAVRSGVIDIISSSHQPQAEEDKKVEFSRAEYGASTLEATFAAARTALNHPEFPLSALIDTITHNPRRVLGLPELSVQQGGRAELTLFDPDFKWQPQREDLRSLSPYSPYLGRELTGKPLGVVTKGKLHA